LEQFLHQSFLLSSFTGVKATELISLPIIEAMAVLIEAMAVLIEAMAMLIEAMVMTVQAITIKAEVEFTLAKIKVE